jgi:hypothetical protein
MADAVHGLAGVTLVDLHAEYRSFRIDPLSSTKSTA